MDWCFERTAVVGEQEEGGATIPRRVLDVGIQDPERQQVCTIELSRLMGLGALGAKCFIDGRARRSRHSIRRMGTYIRYL